MDYKISDDILEKMSNDKFLKKDMRLIVKDVMKSFGLKHIRGSKEIQILGKQNSDKSIIICEISIFDNLYGYWILGFDDKGNLIYDESDGEIRNQNKIENYYNRIDSVNDLKNDMYENIRISIFYPNLYDDIPSYYRK